jgi:DNA mismatch repair protein MutS
VSEDGGEVVFEHRILPGPSDRSYGIHVARLAGLPSPVIARAERLLAEFEGVRPAGANGKGPPTAQGSFFAEPSRVEDALSAVDPDALTPLEAIQQLYELRAMLPGARGSRE